MMDDLAMRFASGTWPKLRKIYLRTFHASDMQLAQMIGGMRQLEELDIDQCEFGPLSTIALRPLHSFLRELDFFM
jgi:hypothetical protein